MGRRQERVRRAWGEVEFRSVVEEVGDRSAWSLQSDRHTLKVLRSGEVLDYRARIGDGSPVARTLRPGSVSLVPAGSRYESSGRGAQIGFSVLTFPGHGKAVATLDQPDEFVYQTTARLDEALTRGEEPLAEALVRALHLHLESRYLTPIADVGLSLRQRQRLEVYLATHLGARPTIDDLAAALGMGRSRFLAEFRQSFGTTPALYVRERRLDQARQRLERGAADLTELALDLGFASHSHLTAAFKARYGVPPRTFRSALPLRKTRRADERRSLEG